MLTWYRIILTLGILYIASHVSRFYRNLRLAQRTGLPYVVAPFPHSIIVQILFETTWMPFLVNRCLPTWMADVINDPLNNYRWRTKNRLVRRFGQVYLVVTPTSIICSVGDAAVVSQIVNARNEFPKPVWQYQVIELYGPNLVTCEDQEWAHHRRHTATTFNERNSQLVWKESIRQTTEMLAHWRNTTGSQNKDVFLKEDIRDDIVKLSLNVLSGAGFGVPIPFTSTATTPSPKQPTSNQLFQDSTPPPGFDFTFRAVVEYTDVKIRSVVLANLMLPRWIPRFLVPFLEKDFAAHRDLKAYMKKLIDTSLSPVDDSIDSKDRTSNLVHGMLASRTAGDSKSAGLTDQEITSNMHIFTLAGHDTNQNTLIYALVLLAMHPHVQDWAYQGIIDAIRDEPPSPSDWDYTTLFPKLITPLCVMLETMRLYPPVVTVPKWTPPNPTPNTAPSTFHFRTKSNQNKNDDTITLPPGTNINLNMNALHYSETYWGPTALTFNPIRWDARNETSFLAQNADQPGLVAPGLEHPGLHRPVRGAYIPFSDGFRACLGKKFAQVEVVAALTVLLSMYRVRLVDGGEEQAKRALGGSFSVVTLAIGEGVPLVFEMRESVA